MANNSDLKRWYKKTKVEKNDFVRHDSDNHSEELYQVVDNVVSQNDGFYITYASGEIITLPIFPGEGIIVDVNETNDCIVIKLDQESMQFKTLFGNQSILGQGNIDLFEHDIRITGTNIDVVFTVYSSKNLKVDSLQDLKAICGDTFVKSCTGKVNNVAAYAITQLKILCIDGTEALLSGVTIDDTLTAI